MKALVLSGGKGTRLRPYTFTTAKQLIPVANKPVLGYVLDQITNAGIKDVGIIIAPDTGNYVKGYVGDGSRWDIKVTYILQEPLGLAHAVKAAESFLGEEQFIMYLGDNLLGEGVNKLIDNFEGEELDALILLKEVENSGAFGEVVLDEKGNVRNLVEKPKKPVSNLALVGVYIFSPRVHEAVERIKPSWRGELEITDVIQEMLNAGFRVKAELLNSWWLDTGKKDDILTANTIILDEFLKTEVNGYLDETSKINGRVRVDEGARVINSVIHGPCIIGRNCLIENALIGPYTSIGDNSKIITSSVERCVILENSLIQGIDKIEDSLIGRKAKVSKSQRYEIVKLNIGDYSEVEI